MRKIVFRFNSRLRLSCYIDTQRTPASAQPHKQASRSGSALLITLGILGLISALAVSYYSVTRINRQTATLKSHTLDARQHLHQALLLAMNTVEDSFIQTNFAANSWNSEPQPASNHENNNPNLIPHRLSLIGDWFNQQWQNDRKVSKNYLFQTPNILGVPVRELDPELEKTWSVNLLTKECEALLPPSLIDRLRTLEAHQGTPFRSGWENIIEPTMDRHGARISFMVADISGFFDANYFFSGPVTQQLQKICFSQPDVVKWTHAQHDADKFEGIFLNKRINAGHIPFVNYSYDPDPDVSPLQKTTDSTFINPYLGTTAYNVNHHRKINLNSITNIISDSSAASGNWTMDPELMVKWLRPVADAMMRANQFEIDEQSPNRLSQLQILSTLWNAINFIDEDRIPHLSIFEGMGLATRHNAAIEDVPLINKVAVFNIFGGSTSPQDPLPPTLPGGESPATYYQVDPTLSNHYAVAVELWYPFAPNSPPPSSACYAGIYTNQSDVGELTFERPFTAQELNDWFRWQEAATSNTVMQTLFSRWADSYTNTVGNTIQSHPLWQFITQQSELWFTTNMTAHPHWPQADDNDNFSITNSPIWQAFYPETYASLTTTTVDEVEIIATNLYTYTTTTNTYLYWEPADGDNSFQYLGTVDSNTTPYPAFTWLNLKENTVTTNFFNGFHDADNNLTLLYNGTEQVNYFHELLITPGDELQVVYSDIESSAVITNTALSLIIAPLEFETTAEFKAEENLEPVFEVTPVTPLPMPEDLGESLSALFTLLLLPELKLDTSDALYNYLMLMPDEFDFDFLGGYLSQYPILQKTIIPVYQEPTLGNLTDKDRVALTQDGAWDSQGATLTILADHQGRTVGESFTSIGKDHGFGTYWVIYPRQTIAFPELTVIKGNDTDDDEDIVVTNYCALGSTPGLSGGKPIEGLSTPTDAYKLYFRPVVTIIPAEKDFTTHDAPGAENQRSLNDRIVDEALLNYDPENPLYGWDQVSARYVADPRHNGYIDCWLPNEKYIPGAQPEAGRPPVQSFELTEWEHQIGTTNLSTEVTEYPFYHLNQPLEQIGDIGYIYTSPNRQKIALLFIDPQTRHYDLNQPLQDTINLTSPPGAYLLDLLTVHHTPDNLPPGYTGISWRGKVQANMERPLVIGTLFSRAELGWNNYNDNPDTHSPSLFKLEERDIITLGNIYTNALAAMQPQGMGWRSFGEMLPSIATNEQARLELDLAPEEYAQLAHNWMEDALRHLPEYLSFRQNIFQVVVAAQTISSGSTPLHPIVLAEQRAMITVIRDAYTGKWNIVAWRWLTT